MPFKAHRVSPNESASPPPLVSPDESHLPPSRHCTFTLSLNTHAGCTSRGTHTWVGCESAPPPYTHTHLGLQVRVLLR
jgi:hypothetical protein